MTAMIPALCGCNLIYGLGLIELGMTFDFSQLMMDSDFAKMIKFALGGIPVNDETLAVEDLHRVGPFGSFLTHKSTFNYRRSQSRPELIDRRMWGAWVDSGKKNLTTVARERALQRLESYTPPSLPEELKKELRGIINTAEKRNNVFVSATAESVPD